MRNIINIYSVIKYKVLVIKNNLFIQKAARKERKK